MLHPDRAKGRRFAARQVAEMCANASQVVVHQSCDGVWLSPAEVYALAVRLLADRIRNGTWPASVPYRYVDGPFDPPQAEMGASALPLDDGDPLLSVAKLQAWTVKPARLSDAG